jgi:tetratricopeptide (TPR) repeat protein
MLSSEVQEGIKALRFKEQVVQAKSHLEELSARLRHVEDEEEAEVGTGPAPVVWDWASAYQKFSQWEDVEELREQKKTEEERLKEIMDRASDNMGHYHDHSEERKLFKLPEAEKMAFCEHHRLLGNALYREGHLHKAAEKYQLALSYYQYCFPEEEALQAQLDAVRLACLCNASLCMRRLGELRAAVDAANEALALAPACTRALLRRAQALTDLDDYPAALSDLRAAQQLVADGGDSAGRASDEDEEKDEEKDCRAGVRRELARLSKRREETLKAEQRLAQAMLQTQTLPPQQRQAGSKGGVWADTALPLEPSWPSPS